MLYVTVECIIYVIDFAAISQRHRSSVAVARCKGALNIYFYRINFSVKQIRTALFRDSSFPHQMRIIHHKGILVHYFVAGIDRSNKTHAEKNWKFLFIVQLSATRNSLINRNTQEAFLGRRKFFDFDFYKFFRYSTQLHLDLIIQFFGNSLFWQNSSKFSDCCRYVLQLLLTR